MPEPDGGAPANKPDLLVCLTAQEWAVVIVSLQRTLGWLNEIPDPRGMAPIVRRAIAEICAQLEINDDR